MGTAKLILSEEVEKLLKDNVTIKKSNSMGKKMDTSLLELVSEKGLLEKTEYSLPLTDTLGQRFFTQRDSQFNKNYI